jgi:hypothetical protein
MRSEYLRALVAHPVGRALALLAVGAEGVVMLEAGRTPCAVSEFSNRPQQSLRTRREPYNCHHVYPEKLAGRRRGRCDKSPGKLGYGQDSPPEDAIRLSDLFIEDLRQSEYYRNLPIMEPARGSNRAGSSRRGPTTPARGDIEEAGSPGASRKGPARDRIATIGAKHSS